MLGCYAFNKELVGNYIREGEEGFEEGCGERIVVSSPSHR